MRHGQLFAGIGGFGLAAQWAGIENVWANEIDPYCCKVLKKNFNGLKIYEQDIREIGKHNLGPVDIITGGFPCQPFSHAGKRKGKEDDRYLWPPMLRVIKELMPSFVIGENVAGLKSMEHGKTLERILIDLEDIGYQVETFLVPACSVGAWHRRDRLWILCRREQTDSNELSVRPHGNTEFKEGFKHNGRGQSFSKPGTLCQDVPNTKSTGQQTCTNENKWGNESGESWGNDNGFGKWGEIKPNVGGMVTRLPNRMDGYWDNEPEGIPRVAKGVKNRVNRLKGLGNAVTPQIPYLLFKSILEYERSL